MSAEYSPQDLPLSKMTFPVPGVLMHSAHAMPFGASVNTAGTRFRTWAPGSASISLVLLDDLGPEKIIPMRPLEGGWFEVYARHVGAGARYFLELPDQTRVPDPASRFQPQDVHGPSEVIAPLSYAWHDSAWSIKPWHTAVIYEIHIGAFSPEGTFLAAIERLDHLVALGVTAIEVMPVADFPGGRNWGYDGAAWYAPESTYGRPEDFKALIEAAHMRGLMVILDVVYNHFGPEGNYLPAIAPTFFTDRHNTPWGAGINYDGPDSKPVREFVLHNAMYWIEEYHLDGLRLDAVHTIMDDSDLPLIEELAQRVRALRPEVHLILENEENEARRLLRGSSGELLQFSAQWNDDVHHALHVAVTGEKQGYYGDYYGDPYKLVRALAEGFVYQGEVMKFRGSARGEPSAVLPPVAFVSFLQNHDQIGNRAFGDRLTTLAQPEALRALIGVYLLLPQVPMLFMGEEWGSRQPFPFFCDFGGALGEAVKTGRRNEFAKFPEFQDEKLREQIPDPQAARTFESAKLNWEALSDSNHAERLALYTQLIRLRHKFIVPLLPAMGGHCAQFHCTDGVVHVLWRAGKRELHLTANLSTEPRGRISGNTLACLWRHGGEVNGQYGPWYVRWSLR